MATTIFFNGRVISTAGSYSEVDASGLEQVGLGAIGIVAVLGTGEGGKPVSEISEVKDLIRLNKPEKVRQTFRSGDLREAGDMVFAPGKDPDILGGAVEMVAMKINPATQSSASFANSEGNALDLTSSDYGEFTAQVNVSIADGTTQGKLLTITFEDVTESVDDLGGDAMVKLKYVAHADGWDTMTGQLLAGGNLESVGTRSESGLDGDMTQPVGATAMEAVSSAAGDTTQEIEIWGLDGSGNILYSKVTLTGTAAVDFTGTFASVQAVRLSAAAVGTVTVQADGGGAAVCTLAPATLTKGMVEGLGMFVNATTIDFAADGATTQPLIVEGTSATGAVQRQKVTLAGAGTVATTANFATITAILLGEVEAARTVTATAVAAKSIGTTQNTVVKLRDYYNAKQVTEGVSTYGFTLTLVTGLLSFDPADLDVMPAASSVLSPTEYSFLADLWAIVNWINTNSQYVDAAAASGASGGAPDNTVAPVFLTGGSEGTPAFSDWQTALTLLKKTRVNSIVALTGDPAVHAAVDAHCAYMGGVGRSERDAFLGALNAGLTDVPTKDEYKDQAVDLNSRHIRLCGQAVERYDTAGERAEFQTPFQALVAAGMQAGSPVGTSLTFKYANVLGFRQDSSWDPVDDSDEMIQAGCMFMEEVEGVGRRWVRNVTTHLSSNNIAYTEGSVNESVNLAVFEFRTEMEWAVGRRGFAGTVNSAKGVAVNKLDLLVDAEFIVLYRSLAIELVVDTLEVSVELAPVIPINFVKNTIHLVTVRQTAE
jgi:hypothetical protein